MSDQAEARREFKRQEAEDVRWLMVTEEMRRQIIAAFLADPATVERLERWLFEKDVSLGYLESDREAAGAILAALLPKEETP